MKNEVNRDNIFSIDTDENIYDLLRIFIKTYEYIGIRKFLSQSREIRFKLLLNSIWQQYIKGECNF